MTDFCVNFLTLLKSWVLSLPDLSIESSYIATMLSSVSVVTDFIAKVNFIVPIDTILLITSLVYGFRLLKFGVFLVNWVIRRIADFFP